MRKSILRKAAYLAIAAALSSSLSSSVLAKENKLSVVKNDGLGVYYELYVNSFYDTNKDGHGDLKGIIEKLDYLNDGNNHTKKDLGVDALWLMPIFPSPTYHKYDTTDYYNVDPQYGTLEDFRNMTSEAHKRGVKVILDLALNHTSNQHPWFQAAVKDKNSPYRDYYIWADENTDLNEKGPWGQQLWYETHPGSGDYYYALFIDFMPDLNLDNPKVHEEAKKIGKFWLDQGADGFRLDAAMHLYSDDIPKNVDFWNEWRQSLREVNPDVYTIGEIWDRPNMIAPYLQGLDSAFNFDLSEKIINAVQSGQDNGLVAFEKEVLDLYHSYSTEAFDAPFLRNHDEERTMSVFKGDVNKAKLAAAMLLTMPGNPYIYYGEEIGMFGEKPDEFIREPFRWYSDGGEGQTTWEDSRDNVDAFDVSVESQYNDKNSLLSYYRDLIHLRQSSEALMKGDIQEYKTGDNRIISYTRNYGIDSVIVLHNLSNQTVTINLTEEEFKNIKVLYPASQNKNVKNVSGKTQISIPASTTVLLNK